MRITRGGIGLGALAYYMSRRARRRQRMYDRQMREHYDSINNANNFMPDSGMDAFMAQQGMRDENIASAYKTLGEMFGDREGLYDEYADASYELGKDYLDEEKGNSKRELKFALARAGLGGGSVDIDKHSELNTRYLDGLSMARSEADSAANMMRNNDMNLRNSLMGLAAGGGISGQQLASMGNMGTMATAQIPSNLGSTFVGLTDYIGATRNPFAGGFGGGSASTSRPKSAGGTQYTGTVVT